MMLSANLFAQNTDPVVHYYYIEEANHDLLNPSKVTENANGTLSLEFTDQNLTDSFNELTIYFYDREFEWSKKTELHKYYLIGVDSQHILNNLNSINEIVFAEYIGTGEEYPLNTMNSPNPDDYIDDNDVINAWVPLPTEPNGGFTVFNVRPYEHLELINARRAWNITTGDPSIAIGVKDINFYLDHPDLENEVFASEVSVEDGTPGSGNSHGNNVMGAAAADTNNGFGIASVGYDSSLIPMNIMFHHTAALHLAENYDEIKVVNISMSGTSSSVAATIFQSVWEDEGVTVVAAAGNGWQSYSDGEEYYHPASFEHVISVSSVGSQNNYGYVDENNRTYDWKDVHQLHVNNPNYTHQHNDKVDIVAPGYSVATTDGHEDYRLSYGTSFASPMVAGTVALMYDVYPDITPDEVKLILQNTADDIYHIPENQPYIGELGAGRLNAYAAVLTAKCMYEDDPNPDLDLMMQNSTDDFGVEPDTETDVIWNSPDIWVRNQPDGHLYKQSEDLEYNGSGEPVYVYVRVTNDSCKVSSGEDDLELYWAKGGLYQQWPDVWDGSSNTSTLEIGDFIQTLSIPELNPGESTILEFEWIPKDPSSYEALNLENPWMFCFLSRIVSSDDLMTTPEGDNAALNARNNNNIAYKNETVINVSGRPDQGSLIVGNIGNSSSLTSDIEFFTNSDVDDNLWQDAEVRVTLNNDLWDLWQNSGGQQSDVRVLDSSQRLLMLTDNHATLNNIAMLPDEWGIATLGVNFLINEVDAQENYNLHVQQAQSSNQEILGGFSYTFIRDNQRQAFNAQTNRIANTDGSETFYAGNINEGAIYNWYDEDGTLIYSGSDFTVNNTIAEEYKLEVIADADGHKDYKTVETEDKRGIEYISPNPATTSTEIGYLLAADDNAFIQLTHAVTGMYYNYILDAESSSQSIPTNQLPQGTYIVNLIANGNILDAKQLIIN